MHKAYYSEFLKRYYFEAILELGKEYPDRKTLIINYVDFFKYDNEVGKRLLVHPDQELAALQAALRTFDLPDSDTENLPDGNMVKAEIAINGLYDSEKIPIYAIGQENPNRLVLIEGIITRIAPIYKKLTVGAFECKRCGEITFLPQPDERFIEPFECGNDVCSRKGAFELIPEESTYENQQKIALQDLYESMRPGQPLREVIVVLRRADLIASVPGMGAQCAITGMVRLQQKKESSLFQTFIEAVYIEPKETEIDLSISEAEKREFRELAAKGDIMQTLINSTAPEILGYETIKSALLCAIVSGSENPHFREYIHLIICGDPGTGKSALLKKARELVPRAQYSAGRGSSVAGLTVAIVKDELSGSGYTAQAGALVLADRGLMVLDEADKLEKEDFQALNTALEESFIEIHKGGINQKFNTRCSVIALCNPKYVRFDQYEPLTKQIAIPPDTLSRFDLLFKIMDISDKKKDMAIAEHQARQWARYEDEDQDTQDNSTLSQEKLIKYISYAKTMKPRTNSETRKAIIDYYLALRIIDDDSGRIAATARQNNGLYRLTKAIAKLRLSDTCSIEDARKAIQIHKESLEALRDPTTGQIDADIILGSSKSQRDRIKIIREIIRDIQKDKGAAPKEEIITKAEESGIKKNTVEDMIQKLKSAGEIIEVSNERFRVM